MTAGRAREEFLISEIDKRDRIIKALSMSRHRQTGVSAPEVISPQGLLAIDHFPITEWATKGAGQHIALPETLADIAEVIGREGALMLAEAYLNHQTGARSWRSQIYVPQRRMADNHPLVRVLGRARAEDLQRTHANLIIEVPRCAKIQSAYRDYIAYQMIKSGQTPEDVTACGVVTIDRARAIRDEIDGAA